MDKAYDLNQSHQPINPITSSATSKTRTYHIVYRTFLLFAATANASRPKFIIAHVGLYPCRATPLTSHLSASVGAAASSSSSFSRAEYPLDNARNTSPYTLNGTLTLDPFFRPSTDCSAANAAWAWPRSARTATRSNTSR